MERRELFSSLASFHKEEKKQEEFIRPPYYSDLSLFHNECSKCLGSCAAACEEDIIFIASDKTPYLLFLKNGCTYCDKCAEACAFGVLSVEAKHQIAATVTINKEKCLSWDHTMCFSCKDPCLENAIDFKAMFMPQIDDKCTACGFCLSRCPTDAIEIKVLS
ncbi:MAG: ferredoxin-type protein NapF [Sulfurimonas sp.]|uniref:ferredoxin-type protein NapF n=1 Tax=Sulfurimonas sp. TaxID=2022749 RepID=UPI002634A639|nr:ferredoxin-type protein NapF [Sulfurimonas sp.]MDD2652677.1 ferredoxin-type protein NapF [Sulfurimonas sp.]MDD3450844.1 ferredoxin-type protein NapF [Sulfurimonas sp.]